MLNAWMHIRSSAMRPLFGYIFLVALIEIPLTSAKRVKQCCAGKRSTDFDFCEYLELSCPPGYVIYNPDVYPTSTYCKLGDICYGLDIPYTDLRVDILNCYWKSKCLIDLSSLRRRSPFIDVGSKCPPSEWRNVVVKEWKCVQTTDVSDICAGNKTHSIDIYHPHTKPSGIVRSHERFPWEYRKDVFLIGNNRYVPRCTMTFNGYMQSHENFSRIAIYVESLDIGDDYNTAVIQDEALQHNKTYIYTFSSTATVNISFGFKFTNNRIKGGSGFVLYYKFLRVGEAGSSVRDLDDVIQTKHGTRATCIHNHQYYCPFRKMCDKKKSKLFVPSDDPNNFCTYRSIRKPGKPKHCLKEKNNACKLPKTTFRARKWSMIIKGNLTENFFKCKWMFKCKGRASWKITFVSNSTDETFGNFTVRHFRCGNPDLRNYTVLVPRINTYTMDEGDVITVEYSRSGQEYSRSGLEYSRSGMETNDELPTHTDFKMIFERSRKRRKKR